MNELTLDYINRKVSEDAEGFVRQCEEQYHSRLFQVSDRICKGSGHSLVMLAGPSSSGKTTTASMLVKYIEQKGRNAVTVSLDDFYLDQNRTPLAGDGSPDFESVEALDVPLIGQCLHKLCNLGECDLPLFSFKKKRREDEWRHVKLSEGDVVIVEGLHALNPVITDPISDSDPLKIYISASSRVYGQDGELLLSKRQVRFVRRLVRDYKHRNSPVEYTYMLWRGVRKGEDKYLFPFSDRADIRINTMHPYEPCAFRDKAIELLSHVPGNSEYYERAAELMENLSLFRGLDPVELPESSLLMEFLG